MGHDGHDHDHGQGAHQHDHRGAHDERHAVGTHGHVTASAGAVLVPTGVAPLEEGSGRSKILHFDAFSGVAGDMTIAALLDLGVPFSVIERAIGALPIQGFSMRVGRVARSGIAATTFDVDVDPSQPQRTYSDIDAMIASSQLPARVVTLARSIFRRLGEAEARVHAIDLAKVHFHEVGAVDAIVDVVGAATALLWLEAEVNVSPLPMGHGFVRALHGVLPLPAPATVSCLAGIPTYGVDVAVELVTPTGAAIVATAGTSFERWPSFSPERVGWGAGSRELADRPNLLRLVLGSPVSREAIQGHDFVVIEANIDDMSGELASHALDALRAAGAVDAWIVPVLMKKGRPGIVVSVLARAANAEALGRALLVETSSIGVRFHPVDRIERPRAFVNVVTPYGSIPVKVSGGPFGPPQVKPEFDACARAARDAGVPVRVVLSAAVSAAAALSGLEGMPSSSAATHDP